MRSVHFRRFFKKRLQIITPASDSSLQIERAALLQALVCKSCWPKQLFGRVDERRSRWDQWKRRLTKKCLQVGKRQLLSSLNINVPHPVGSSEVSSCWVRLGFIHQEEGLAQRGPLRLCPSFWYRSELSGGTTAHDKCLFAAGKDGVSTGYYEGKSLFPIAEIAIRTTWRNTRVRPHPGRASFGTGLLIQNSPQRP